MFCFFRRKIRSKPSGRDAERKEARKKPDRERKQPELCMYARVEPSSKQPIVSTRKLQSKLWVRRNVRI